MNDEDVRRQLQSMIAFIQQEAEEKYTEIVNKARDDFALEKQRLKDTYKAKIDKEFDAKESQFELNKKM